MYWGSTFSQEVLLSCYTGVDNILLPIYAKNKKKLCKMFVKIATHFKRARKIEIFRYNVEDDRFLDTVHIRLSATLE